MSDRYCVNCKFFSGGKMWYHHWCGAPAVQIKPPFDYVTGTQPPCESPHCRDVNRDGRCPHYVQIGYVAKTLRSLGGNT